MSHYDYSVASRYVIEAAAAYKGLLREPLLFAGFPMDCIAVFVDAGYLFAQGSTVLSGRKQPRTSLVLDAPKALGAFEGFAAHCAPECRLLRIYWYDGAIGGIRPTADQALLAHSDNVKLRLGFVNLSGQQKGVDSLIVTDLIELARLKSICDAVLLAGDEDIRIGVQIAQNYGVRVHLLGIAPSRGSQSRQLMQESDTTTEWGRNVISGFLAIRDRTPDKIKEIAEIASPAPSTDEPHVLVKIEAVVKTLVDSLTSSDIQGIVAYWESERGVPSEFDRKMLPACGAAIGRGLERNEIRHMRSCFQREVKGRIAENSS